MLRALLTLVLTTLVALPHGVCFCEFLHAASPTEEECCHSLPLESAPTEPEDDPDHDCPCRLVQEMVLANNEATSIIDDHHSLPFFLTITPVDFGFCSAYDFTTNRRRLDPLNPTARLIPCALRI